MTKKLGRLKQKRGEEQERNLDGRVHDLPDPRAGDPAISPHHAAVEHPEHDDRQGERAEQRADGARAPLGRRRSPRAARRPRAEGGRSGSS